MRRVEVVLSLRGRPTPPDVAGAGSLEPEEFAARFATRYNKLWIIAAAISGDRTHADDIVQDAALVALRKLDQFEVGTNLTAWLAQMVRLTAMNYVRKTRQRRTAPVDPNTIDQTTSGPDTAVDEIRLGIDNRPELSAHQTAFDDDVLRALQSVPDMARACLLLRVVYQLPYGEIAEMLHIAEGTAMSHVHRSKRELRRRLAATHGATSRGKAVDS